MTIHEISQPRYKVVASYPDMPYRLGEIITGEEGYYGEHQYLITYKEYPAIFKKLEWWEERSEDELRVVEYMAWTQKDGSIYRFKLLNLDKERKVAVWNKQGYGPPLLECLPITEGEYLVYKTEVDA